jgi:hypothetical protein
MQAEPVRRKTSDGEEEVPGEYVYSGGVANKALELIGKESAHQVLNSAGLAQRCQIVDGSFFESERESGDAYVMKAILHDWDDHRSIDILRTCCRVMSPRATLLMVDRVIGPPNEIPEGKFSDLNMLVQYAGIGAHASGVP